jgi:hypothetical protein
MLYDYPKHDYARARTTDPIATTLEFKFDDAEAKAFKEKFKRDAPSKITLTTTYGIKTNVVMDIKVESDDLAQVSALAKQIAQVPVSANNQGVDVMEPVRKAATALLQVIDGGDYQQIRASAGALVAAVKPNEAHMRELPLDPKATLERAQTVQSAAELLAQMTSFATEHLPAFIYFDQYGILRTRINLTTYASKKDSQEAEVRTQAALFEWAHVAPDELQKLGQPKQNAESQAAVERRKEERRTLLESASFSLTGDWKNWWPQQREHRLHMTADGDDLVLQVSDDKNPWRVDFQERSGGFQWFFSFYLTFLVESGKAHQGAILLLDEPGLHLHITAQQRLLSFFQTVSKKNQIIYSTHSPFMVDGDHFDNVRTVYLKPDPNSGYTHTTVSPSTEPEGDHDTILPLQAALGYSLAQTLFLGKKVVIVEGVTDYWVLKALSTELMKRRRQYLPDDMAVLFAGGTARVLPLVSLFLQPDQKAQRLVVLLDADKAGLDKAAKLKRDLLRQDRSVALMSDTDLLGRPNVEMEDVISRASLAVGLEKRKGPFKSTQAKTAATNVAFLRAVYDENGWGELTHDEKALIILAVVDMWREGTGPDADTLVNAERVIAGLIGRFT